MRSISWIWAAVLILGILTIGSAISPFQAFASNRPPNPSVPTVANATLSEEKTAPSTDPSQLGYTIALSLSTDKPAYLTGDTIAITVITNLPNTDVNLVANLPGGGQQQISRFTTSSQKTVLWTAPETTGQIQLTCLGQAELEEWTTCVRYVCLGDGSDCHLGSYLCLRPTVVQGNASNSIRVFSRVTSISGRVLDTNQLPVAGATVSLASVSQATSTNAEGSFVFSSYQIGSNYTLVNQIPTVTDTISVNAIACAPQPGKAVQVQAEIGASNVDFTITRAFYPPGIDLSDFTFAAFSGWPDASNYTTWQNILGITISGPVELTKLSFGSTETPTASVNIGNKKLYLITNPRLGDYLVDLQAPQNAQYAVAAAATLNNKYFLPVSVSGVTESKNGQQIKLTLKENGVQLTPITPFSLLWVIIPVIVVVIGCLVAADFLTGKRVIGRIQQAFTRTRSPRTGRQAAGKTKIREAKTKIAKRRHRRK